MHSFEPSQRQVRVDLGGGNIGVAEQQLHRAQVRAVLHHVGGATVAQRCAGWLLRCWELDQQPDRLAGERHTAQGEKEARGVRNGSAGARGTDASEMRAALGEIGTQGLAGR
jgi:hypothetical protein